MKKTIYLLLALLVVLNPSSRALAHDYWLQPSTFKPAPAETFQVHLYFGEAFKPEGERPFQKIRTPVYTLISSHDQQDLTTIPDQTLPLSTLTLTESGTYLLVLDRTAQTIILPAKKFNAYLREEGLTDILQQRQQTRQSNRPGRERYQRNLKSLLQVATLTNNVPLLTLGKQLEIIPQQNPYTLQPGNRLTIAVQFEGRPLANRLVTAYQLQGTKRYQQTSRTNQSGLATFTLQQKGIWLIRLVHMRRCQTNCQAIDWESFWSSMTFVF